MYAYYHHIGDYRKDTAHLSLVEHGIYRQLLDTYYLDERPLTLDHAKLMRSHSVRSADEMQAFENVLQDFFVRTEEGYVHKRCESEIAQFKAKSDSASKSAKARWAKHRSDGSADAMRTHTEGNANQQPVTDNHNPSPAVKGTRGSRLPNDWVPSDDDVAFCKTERPDLDWRQVAAEFRDYWTAKSGKDAAKTKWDATWRNWVRRQRAASGRSPPNFFDERAAVIAELTGATNEHDDRTIDV